MYDIILWFFTAILFILSLAAVVIPFMPDTVFLWSGILLHNFFNSGVEIPVLFWILFIFITVLILSSDYLVSSFFIKRFGGNKWSILAGLVGILLGPLFLGPVGILLGPFILVFLVGYIQQDFDSGVKSALGSMLAFLSSSFVKIVFQVFIFAWYIFIVIFNS